MCALTRSCNEKPKPSSCLGVTPSFQDCVHPNSQTGGLTLFTSDQGWQQLSTPNLLHNHKECAAQLADFQILFASSQTFSFAYAASGPAQGHLGNTSSLFPGPLGTSGPRTGPENHILDSLRDGPSRPFVLGASGTSGPPEPPRGPVCAGSPCPEGVWLDGRMQQAPRRGCRGGEGWIRRGGQGPAHISDNQTSTE